MSDKRVGFREIQLCEDEWRHEDVEQEVVGLDDCANSTRDDSAAQLPAVLGLGKPVCCTFG